LPWCWFAALIGLVVVGTPFRFCWDKGHYTVRKRMVEKHLTIPGPPHTLALWDSETSSQGGSTLKAPQWASLHLHTQ
jgi:hypothetical protein